MESVKVEEEKPDKYIKMVFSGKTSSREDFLDLSITHLFLYFFNSSMHVVLVLIREMIKNIYDHGTGEGILILKKEGLDYEFDFIDNNKEIVNFDNLCTVKSNNGWTKKSKKQFRRWSIND